MRAIVFESLCCRVLLHPMKVAVIRETERRTKEHKHERDVMRQKKRDVMARKNKASKALEQQKVELAEAEEKKAQADQYVSELRARGDGNDLVARQLEQWQAKKDGFAKSLDQSQQVLLDERSAYSKAMVCLST